MSWKVGDRFHHTAGDRPGTVLEVNKMAGTAYVRYDDNGYGSEPEFTLAFSVMAPLSASPSAYKADDDGGSAVIEKDFVFKDKRTSQLLNEMYHDRARLEKLISNVSVLAGDTARALQELAKEQEWTKNPVDDTRAELIVMASKLAQFSEEHG